MALNAPNPNRKTKQQHLRRRPQAWTTVERQMADDETPGRVAQGVLLAMGSSNPDSCGKPPVQRPEPEGRIRHLQLHTGDPLRPDAPQIAGHREDAEFLALRVRNVHPEQVVIRVLSGLQRRPEDEQRPDSLRIHPFRRLHRNAAKCPSL